LYYGQMHGKAVACEVLLDNGVWEEMQAEMAAAAWPAGEEFYSVRLFLVLRVQPGGPVGPETAVAWLADVIAGRDDFTEDDLYAALAEAGVPDSVADRAFKFTQTAWGRAFLDGLGVQFPADYLCFNGAGEVAESGLLADEPYYVAAAALARRYAGSPGFTKFAHMSADVAAINDALHAGSKPEDLAGGPAAFFTEPVTRAGMDKVQRLLAQRAAAGVASGPEVPRPAPTGKPWWRFW
jgi:hypothetical protein